jgi:two-component sensor histidine kinase
MSDAILTALPVRRLWPALALGLGLYLFGGDMAAIGAPSSGRSPFEPLQSDLAEAEDQNDLQVQIDLLRERSAMEAEMGMPIASLQSAFQLLDLAQATGDPLIIAQALQCSSTAHHANARNDEALAAARNALAILVAAKQQDAAVRAQHFLLDMLGRCGRYREAFDMADEMLAQLGPEENTIAHARIWWAMARNSLAQGQYTNASHFLFRARPAIMAEGGIDERFDLDLDRARVAISLHRSDDATSALNEAAALLPDVKSNDAEARLDEVRYAHAQQREQWRDALLLLQSIQARKDSIDRAAQRIIVGRLQTMHHLDDAEDHASPPIGGTEHEPSVEDRRAGGTYFIPLVGGILFCAVALFISIRHNVRTTRRSAVMNALVRKQRDEIQQLNIELQRQHLRLAEALLNEEQQEITMKEIHHRVKNNLQVVDSLLTAQAIDNNDPRVERLLREAQSRIRSMASVHEHIYRTGSRMPGTLQDYLSQLVRNVIVAYGVHDRISVSVNAHLPMLEESALMPLSLLLNELITNSVKYAFIGRDTGHIRIAVRAVGGAYELVYTDNGAGFTDAAGERPTHTFGLDLVRALADQLNGEMEPVRSGGTGFKLTFRPDGPVMRVAS